MAMLLKRKRLFNPSRKRRKNLTPKQIKYFGTKRQRANLKNRKINKGRVRRRKNIGEIITLDLRRNNPARKTSKRRKNSMAKYSRRRRNSAKRHRNVKYVKRIRKGIYQYSNPSRRRRRKNYSRRRKANSGVRTYRRRRRTNYGFIRRRRRNSSVRRARRRNSGKYYSRRRRNPGVTGAVAKAIGIVIGVGVTNFALNQISNFMPSLTTGMLEYATGVVLALTEGWIVSKFLKRPTLGEDIAVGGIVLMVIKAINANFSQFSVGLSGLRRRGGLGLIGNSSFVWPSVLAGPGQFGSTVVAPSYMDYTNKQIAAMQAASVSKAGMGSIYPGANDGGRLSLKRGVRMQ